MKAHTKRRAGVISVALALFLLLQLLSEHPAFVENYYSTKLYPLISGVIARFSSQFSFSLSEFVLWLILLFGIPFIINRIRNKRMSVSHVFLNLFITLAVLVTWFYFAWGINYYRLPLISKLQLDEFDPLPESFDTTYVAIVEKANDLNVGYKMHTVDQIDQIINDSYSKIGPTLQLSMTSLSSSSKTFLINWILNKTTTSGWFSPFFHEPHYNKDLFIFQIPFVVAHEKAHLLGYTSEAEANFLAHLVCINSDELLVQYSGYFGVLGYFLGNVSTNYEEDKREFYYEKVNEGVKLDIAAVNQRWKAHRGTISKLSKKGYDAYLKANKVKEGIANYSKVVDLLIRYYEKEDLPKTVDE